MKLEHLIYGTFPDLPGSQQVVYKSSGISPELESWLIQSYDAFGDCKTEDFRSSLTLQWCRESEIQLAVLTKVTHAGQDFSGRWGALLRHSAILTQEQLQSLFFDVSPVAAQLVSTGASEELAQSGDLEIEATSSIDILTDKILPLNLAHYNANLKRLLTGKRLVLYADLNTDHLNAYLHNLLSLLPFQFRAVINWSEFVFHSLPELDLSVVHSSRYSAPESDTVEFQSDGENTFNDFKMTAEAADEYISQFSQAQRNSNRESLAGIIGLDNSPDQPEPSIE
ncbi:MAG: hypothetical protein WBP29_13880 [Candidatus Zixiibacteriota bacterium]